MVYHLNAYPTNTLLAPPLSENVLAENEVFWTKTREETLEPLVRAITQPSPRKNPAFVNAIVKRAHLITEPNNDAALLGALFAHPLVYWGVELQKAGRLTNAAACSFVAAPAHSG